MFLILRMLDICTGKQDRVRNKSKKITFWSADMRWTGSVFYVLELKKKRENGKCAKLTDGTKKW